MAKYLDLFIKNSKSRIDELKITQNELARRLGVAHTNVSQLLSQKRGAPNLTTIEEWEVALGLNPGDLLRDGDRPKSEQSTPQKALAIIADALDCFLLPSSAPKEIEELLRLPQDPSDWQKVEEALKLALVPGYAEQILNEGEKENAG